MEEIIIHLYLGFGAIRDIKSCKLPIWYLLLGIGLATIFYITNEPDSGLIFLWSLLPAFIFIIYSVVKKEGPGMGDTILLGIMGVWISSKILVIWYLSLLLICLFSMALLSIKKITLNQRLPYYPFFWLAYILIQGGSYV